MASKEFIQKRIAGKLKEIEKLNAKLERIRKAESSGWEANNPYMYGPHDLHWALKDLEAAKAALAEYQSQLGKAEEMEASRNVPAITEFLNNWYTHSVDYFLQQRALYLAALKERQEVNHSYRDWCHDEGHKVSMEVRYQKMSENETYNRNFHRQWSHVIQFDNHGKPWEETMKAALKEEYNRKYDFIITRTNEIVGQITDASNLRVGAKGDLNGYIVGTKGTAKVQTIGAGGYNIQCFHFRTLINPMKEAEQTTKQPEQKPEPKQTTSNTAAVTADTNFKAMTIQELKEICSQLKAECKVYENEAIYRMRLVMAIKKAI